MPEKLLKAPLPIRAQSALPLPFKSQILLEIVLTDLTVDLAIIRLLLVRIFLDQVYFQVRVNVCSRHLLESLQLT